MPQSLARLTVHLIFSTKNRQPFLRDGVRNSLHRYMAVVLQNLGCPAAIINSVEDHVHILFDLVEPYLSVRPWKKSRRRPPNGSRLKVISSRPLRGRRAMARSPFQDRTCPQCRTTLPASTSIIERSHFRRSIARYSCGIAWTLTSATFGISTPLQG